MPFISEAVHKPDIQVSDLSNFVCLLLYLNTAAVVSSQIWHIDSGATARMTFHCCLFEFSEDSALFDVKMINN